MFDTEINKISMFYLIIFLKKTQYVQKTNNSFIYL